MRRGSISTPSPRNASRLDLRKQRHDRGRLQFRRAGVESAFGAAQLLHEFRLRQRDRPLGAEPDRLGLNGAMDPAAGVQQAHLVE
jgi:hypothetical protein